MQQEVIIVSLGGSVILTPNNFIGYYWPIEPISFDNTSAAQIAVIMF